MGLVSKCILCLNAVLAFVPDVYIHFSNALPASPRTNSAGVVFDFLLSVTGEKQQEWISIGLAMDGCTIFADAKGSSGA